jgi:hypothetical protein
VTSHPPRRTPAPRQPGQITRRLCSASLVGQALSVFFGALVAWQLDRALAGGSGTTLLWGGSALAVLCVVAAGAMRSRAGIYLGWLCQVLTLACALVLPAMAVVGVLFLVLWWVCLRNGLRIDADRARAGAGAGAG